MWPLDVPTLFKGVLNSVLNPKNTQAEKSELFQYLNYFISAHVQNSSAAFALAEELTRRGYPNDRILSLIGQGQTRPQGQPQTTLSMEEQQIEQSLARLDDRLFHLQENNGFNGIDFHNRH